MNKIFIDNEETRAAEESLRLPAGIRLLWALALSVLLVGFYLAC